MVLYPPASPFTDDLSLAGGQGRVQTCLGRGPAQSCRKLFSPEPLELE